MSGFEELDVALHEEPENLSTQHTILHRYCFWFHKRHQKIGASAYEESIKQLASFQTIEHFWRIYDHLIRVNDVKTTTDFHLFKQGIKPTWEDPQNEKGGKWMIRLKKGLSSRYWEEIVLAIIGEQFDVGHEICGAVISVRAAEDILSIWNKNSDNTEAKNKIRDQMKKILRLPNYVAIEYKVHRDSLTDGSSFRNTAVWRPNPGPRGSSWNGTEGGNPPAGAPGYHSNKTYQQGTGHRSHTTQPPGDVTGDGSAWGAASSNKYQGGWKRSNVSIDGSQAAPAQVPSVVSTLGDGAPAEKPKKSWHRSDKDGSSEYRSPTYANASTGGGGWGRSTNAAPATSNFQHKGPDDERGGNYGDVSETGHKHDGGSRGNAASGSGSSTYQPRRRYEGPAAQQSLPADHASSGQGARRTNAADQVKVWGRAQPVVPSGSNS